MNTEPWFDKQLFGEDKAQGKKIGMCTVLLSLAGKSWVFMSVYALSLAAHERNKDRETGDRVPIGKHTCIALL